MNGILILTKGFRKNYVQVFAFIPLCFLFLLTPQISHGQPSELSFRAGYGFHDRQDQIFSPFVHHDGSILNFGLQYDWGKKSDQFVALDFGSYNPILVPSYTYNEDDITYPHNITLVNLTYGLGKKMKVKREGDEFTLGGFFEADVQAISYNYAWIGTSGYIAPFSLGLWADYQYHITPESKLTGKVLFPLVSQVARSPYLANDDEYIENNFDHNGVKTFFSFLGDGDLQTLNRIQQLEINLGYQHQLSDRWSIGGLYAFRFIHESKPLNFLSYRNTFYFNLAYSL